MLCIYLVYTKQQQNKYCNRKSENFEIITFLPIIFKSVARNPKTLSESGGDYMIPVGRDEILSRFAGILAVL